MENTKEVAPAVKRRPPNAGKGRPKGSKNKLGSSVKDAIIEAAEAAGGEGGMVAYLARQAVEQPAAFMGLLGKLLPLQHGNDPDNPLTISVIERRIVQAGN